MSTTENLAVIPEVRHEDNGSLEDLTDHQPSLAKKDIDKSPTLSSQTNKSSNPDLVKKKKKKDKSRAASNDTRYIFIRFVIYTTFLIVNYNAHLLQLGQDS